jgi:hypothetical protein
MIETADASGLLCRKRGCSGGRRRAFNESTPSSRLFH